MAIPLFNDHNVYILGAGFSAHRGLPLMSQFTHRMRDAYAFLVAEKRSREADAIETVLRFRMISAAAAYRVQLDLENIEELFSLASVAGDENSRAIRLAIAATIDYAEITSAEPHSTIKVEMAGMPEVEFPPSWIRRERTATPARAVFDLVPPFYQAAVYALLGRFGNTNSATQNTFISFNYDLLVESALAGIGQPFSYGFASAQETVNLDGTSKLLYDPASNVRLLKLHGSMNWATESGSTAVTLASDYGTLRSASMVPELVPPTWRKSFTPALQSVWGSAVDAIRSATRLIVVGFSVPPTDLHFKYLVAAGLQGNLSIRDIVFFDPNDSVILDRAQTLFADLSRQPAVRVIKQSLEHLISNGTGPGTIDECGRHFSSQIQSVHNARP